MLVIWLFIVYGRLMLFLILFVSFWFRLGDLYFLYWDIKNGGIDCIFLLCDEVCIIVCFNLWGSEFVLFFIMLDSNFWKFELNFDIII